MKVVWTEEMKQMLKTLSAEDISYNNIAILMSATYGAEFTKNSVIGMAKRIGVPRREPVIKVKIEPVITPKEFTIYDLEWGMCKWPLGGPYDKPPFLYCGVKTDGGSWCPTHCKKAFNSSSFSSQRPAR